MSNFCNIEQYCCNFDMVRMRMAFAFIIFLFDFSLSSHFFNWFFLSPHNLSLSPNWFFPLQIRFAAPPSTSNVFLSLCTSNQTQKSSFFSLYRATELWTGSWLVETVDGSVGLGFLAGCWLSFGFGWRSWLCRLPVSISPLSNSTRSRLPLSRCIGLSDLAHHHLTVQVI